MNTLDGLELPDDLVWLDEYAWSPVKQSVSVAVDGSLIIEAGMQLTGRPMTLSGGQDAGWVSRATLEALRGMLYQPATARTLVMQGVSYAVIFVQPGGVAAQPVVDYADPGDDDFYSVTLKFLQL